MNAKQDLASERFWAQVAAFGALWGAVEITLGAFINAIKLPFSGSLLAAIGALILVAQRQVLSRPGISLATGVVAALCKSISPGGIILGPMLGILSEALAIELVLSLAGRTLLGALLAGALAALTTVVQHVTSLWLFYGGGILDLYVTFIERTAAAVGLPERAGWWVVAVVAAIIGLVGLLGGAIGWRLGRDARINLSRPSEVCLGDSNG